MSIETFKVDGYDITIESGAFRERVYLDGAQVSNASLVRPAISRVHAFVAGSPPARFEVRTYGMSGWMAIREGRLVASRRPGWVFGALFVSLGLINWLEFAFQRRGTDLVSAVLFTIGGGVTLVPYLGWTWLMRRWSRDSSNPAMPSTELR